MRIRSSRSLLPLALALTAGCSGKIAGPLAEDPPIEPPPPVVPPPPFGPVMVPQTLGLLATTSTCAALAPREQVLGVSPEGHLWLGTSSVATTLRVLDAWDMRDRGEYEVPVRSVTRLAAWTATTASMIADGALWHFSGGERTAVSLPTSLGTTTSLCGDPSRRAFVLTDGALYQRVEREWLRWTGLDSALSADSELLTRDGECAGLEDRVWIASGALQLWALTPISLSNPGLLTAGHHPALRGEELLALSAGNLFRAPEPWEEWEFEAGQARLLAAAGSYAWIVAGDALLRFDGEVFERVELAAESLSALYPHASGGLWVSTDTSVCHVAPDPMLRVRGLRHGEQRTEASYRLEARATRDDMSVVANVDGVEVPARAVDDGWFAFDGALALGWHTVEVSAEESDALRLLSVKLLPSHVRTFQADVRPIYENNCTGAACHVASSLGGAPDLSRYEEWTSRASRIRDRVIRRGDMPPVSVRSPSWGEDEVTIIDEWLSGGMRP